LNDLRQKGIQIGQVEFFKTELPALRQAMIDLEKTYREKQTDSSKAITTEKLEAMTNITRPLFGQTFDYDPTRNLRFEMNMGKINRYKNTTGFLGLGGDDYGEEEAERFRGIIGMINNPSNIDERLAYAIEAYAEKFEDSTKGLFNGVNEQELSELRILSDKIERLIEATNKNTDATEENTSETIEVHVSEF
jgi:hypothetical protein